MRILDEPDPGGASRALSLFRVLLATTLLVQALATARDLPLFVGHYGLMQREINDALVSPALPRLSWLRGLWTAGPLSEMQVIYVLLAVYLVALFYVLAGLRTPLFAAIALVLHLLFKASGISSAYGAYEIATNGLFFCIFLPVSRHFTLATAAPELISVAGARTVLRIYLSVVYVSSGIEKLSGPMWRDGDAIWRFLMRPEVTIAGFGWLSRVPWLTVLAGWSVLAIEIGWVACIVFPRTRAIWLAGAVAMHLSIAATFGLWAFSLTMIALNCGALGRINFRPSAQFLTRFAVTKGSTMNPHST